MKKVVVAMALLMGLTVFAQKREHSTKKDYRQDLTAAQLATLKTKKMTLALDLTKTQQQQIMELNLAEAEFRKQKMEERKAQKESGELQKPSNDERFANENARLDRQIAQQEKIKQILNEDQYQLWKKYSMGRHAYGKKRMRKEGRRG